MAAMPDCSLVPVERIEAQAPAAPDEPLFATAHRPEVHTDAYNQLVCGDNLAVLGALQQSHRGQLDLIYLDPPFATGGRFHFSAEVGRRRIKRQAYGDRWGGGLGPYLEMMSHRLELMYQLLSPRGSLLIHADWRASDHLRLLLDEIFGASALVNEIAWCYGGGGAPRRHYGRKHDTILWYSRGKDWIFHRQYRPYTEKTRKRGLTRVKGPRYSLRKEGAGLDDWWHGQEVQKILSPTAHENLKYPTQKPEGLLRRIITGHSDPHSLVADFFCGSGTTLAVAEQLGRRWIGCDAEPLAVQVVRKRLLNMPQRRRGFEVLAARTSGGAATPEPGAGRMEIRIVPGATLSVRVSLQGFEPEDPALREELQGEARWLDLVDSWAVDFRHHGGCFELDWCSCRSRQDPQIEQTTPAHRYPGPGTYQLAVKLVDLLGHETVLVQSVQIPDP